MKTRIKSRNDRISAEQAMADGLRKHRGLIPTTVSVGSHPMSCDDLIAVYEGLVASSKAVVEAEAAHKAAIEADKQKRAALRTTTTAARRLIVAMFLASPDTLADFGLQAPKTPVRTAEDKAQAASKARETRKVLGTKGRRQKKEALAVATQHAAPAAPPAKPAS
jgi:hypothetical protein